MSCRVRLRQELGPSGNVIYPVKCVTPLWKSAAWETGGAEELAILLQRHSRYVRNNYLRPLMRDGRLEMTNPNGPSDPQQAYRAVAAAAPDLPA